MSFLNDDGGEKRAARHAQTSRKSAGTILRYQEESRPRAIAKSHDIAVIPRQKSR
jgi:hypothetical protein